jgi:hypothetical protein
MLSYSLFTPKPEAPPSSNQFFFLKAHFGESTATFFLFCNVFLHLFFSIFNLGQCFLWIVLLMHKEILKDFCQYQGILTYIFLIPLILVNIFIAPIEFTTQTIEYNLCPIYLCPFFAFTNVITFLLLKYCTFLLLINDKYNGRISDRVWQTHNL